MPISFLILTYNSSSFIKGLLDSIFQLLDAEINKGNIEVIIVDNASTDNTYKIISQYPKKITFKKTVNNLGYAKGINYAQRISGGELLVVINPDATLLEFDHKKISEEFKNSEKLAIAGLGIIDFLGKREKTAGRFLNPATLLLYAIGLEKAFGLRFAPVKKSKVDFVSGGFVVFRKSSFEKLKGYDEDYFMYVEDMDICYRAKKAGMNVAFFPWGFARHKGQGSSNREFAIVNIYKGLLLFYKKHGSLIDLIYVTSLLTIKATLIIFVGTIFGKKESTSTYSKALKAIS